MFFSLFVILSLVNLFAVFRQKNIHFKLVCHWHSLGQMEQTSPLFFMITTCNFNLKAIKENDLKR